MRFLITAGPTREHLDDVRFISNASSGRMGYEIARVALRRGHRVSVVSGPSTLQPPAGAKVAKVVSAEQMYNATARLFPKCDCLIGAAAPADFTPVRRATGKPKKRGGRFSLELKPTIDILETLGKRKSKKQIVIAFALEAHTPVKNAIEKMRRKNADAVLLNYPSAMAAASSTAHIFTRDGKAISLANAKKSRIALALVKLAEELGRSSTRSSMPASPAACCAPSRSPRPMRTALPRIVRNAL